MEKLFSKRKLYDLLPLLKKNVIKIKTDWIISSNNFGNKFTCPICLEIVNNPISCEKCEKLFCSECVNIWKNNSDKCANCRNLFNSGLVPENLIKLLNSLIIKCPNNTRGCLEQYTIEDIYTHLESCEFYIIQAKCFGCGSLIDTSKTQNEINLHIDNCPEVEIQCKVCQKEIRRSRFEDHFQICEKYETIIAQMREKLRENEEEIQKKKAQLKMLDIQNYSVNCLENDEVNSVNLENFDKLNWEKLHLELKENKLLNGHTDSVNCLIQMNWNKNSTTIVSCSSDRSIMVWDLKNNNLVKTLLGHADVVSGLIQIYWENDDSTIASCSWDETIKIWDVEKGECLKTITGQNYYIHCLTQLFLSEKSTIIASGSGIGSIKLWDIDLGECILTIFAHNCNVLSLIYIQTSSEEKMIASAGGDKIIKLYNANSGTIINSLFGHTDTIFSIIKVEWLKNNSTIASGSTDKTIRIWDVIEGNCILLINTMEETNCLFYLQWSICDSIIVVGNNRHIQLWDIYDGTCILSSKNHEDEVYSAVQIFNKNNEICIMSGSRDKLIKLCNLHY